MAHYGVNAGMPRNLIGTSSLGRQQTDLLGGVEADPAHHLQGSARAVPAMTATSNPSGEIGPYTLQDFTCVCCAADATSHASPSWPKAGGADAGRWRRPARRDGTAYDLATIRR